MRRNEFHNSKSVFMWLSICGFGMIIGTHPHLSEALGSSSQTWFVILNLIQDRWIHSQAINVAAYIWFPDQVRDDKYREPHLKEDVSIIHCSLCIVHYSLCIVKRSSAQANYELLIMSYALYNVRECVCVWGVLNHLNPFYGEKRRFTVKKRCFTAGKRRFCMRKAAVFNQ